MIVNKSLRLQIDEWLSDNAKLIQLKTFLNKLAFILFIAAYLLPGSLSSFYFGPPFLFPFFSPI